MSVFDLIKGAKPTGGGEYFESGHEWIVLVNQVKQIQDRDTNADKAYIVECKVLTTTHPTVRPGSERSWYVDLNSKYPKMTASDLVAFGMIVGEVITGEPMEADEIDGDAIKALTMADQPLAGHVIKTLTYTKSGKTFTKHKWYVPTKDELTKATKVGVELGLMKPATKTAAK
jgi:hypothetical protein